MDNSLEKEALAAVNAAERLSKQEKWRAAEFKFNEAAELYIELQDTNPNKAYLQLPHIYVRLAGIAHVTGDIQKECAMYEKAIEGFKRLSNVEPEETYLCLALLCNKMAFAKIDLKLNDNAVAYLVMSIDWYVKSIERGYDVDVTELYPIIQNTPLDASYESTFYAQFLAAYRKGMHIRRSMMWDAAAILEEAGKWSHKKGDDEKALELFIEAVQIYQKATHEEQVFLQVRLAQLIAHIANIHDGTKNIDQAYACFEQSAGLYDDLAKRNLEGNDWVRAYVHYRAGIIAVSYRDDLPKAVYHLKQALPIWEALAQQDKDELHYVAETRFYIGYCMGSVEPKVSIEEFQKAKAIFKQCTDDDYSAQINQIDQILAQNFGIR